MARQKKKKKRNDSDSDDGGGGYIGLFGEEDEDLGGVSVNLSVFRILIISFNFSFLPVPKEMY